MTTCFLFTQHLDEESCLSLRLDQQGQVDAALMQRNFAEIKALQANAQTYIVAPGQRFSLHQLELPWLADRKARAAIPFALEDRLAQDVDTLHFAFDRNHYQHGKYLLAVGDKAYLHELIAIFDKQQINFSELTLDWFALKPHEIALVDSAILVNDDTFQGNLSPELVSFHLSQWTNDQILHCFSDSDKSVLTASTAHIITHEESSYVWLAQRLLETKPLNLCQGELQHGNSQVKTKHLYQAAIAMSVVWLLSIIVVNLSKVYLLNNNIAAVDKKIAAIYHEFFPEAHQVISPKFRVSQLLKTNQNSSELTFWALLDKLTKTAKENPVTIEQLRFQNQTLLVTLATKNFASLEDFQTALQKDNVKVRQTQASTLNQQVVSTLELTL